ncbi:ferredoxin [Umezawaea endophytica]|uniref:Ferredoxin n=1 Tax=Umezawaea endophytica TaxID=1654476 RepID=A0A9X2VRS7_9PSEU|nr:ferredoxin [Umezawaea endophytica]MCS7481167.1 ferredoxin [Umezawaea endophytica]
MSSLDLDPIACRAHGLCADLLPEVVDLDEWGYPLLHGDTLPAHLVPAARRAASACPALALRVTERSRQRSA